MDMEFGVAPAETAMKENGSKEGNMEKEYTNIKEALIEDSLRTVLNMDTVKRSSKMEINIQECTRTVNHMGSVDMIGRMAVIMKVSLCKDTEKARDKFDRNPACSTKVTQLLS